MNRWPLGIMCGLLLIGTLVVLPGDVQGCGGAYHPGERVDVADETALIIWDEATKTEHFIRSASFVGSAYDFGFLVPTPTKPDLNEADSELFANLAAITKPKVEYRLEPQIPFGCGGGVASTARSPADELPAGVVVLDKKRVGGFVATVLGFRKDKKQDLKDAAADFLDWLNRNQYAVRPDLEEWLLPYIRDDWVITAFKVALSGQNNKGLKTSTVRMSFQTEKPFFPYREPADQRDEKAWNVPRLLRVFIAARQRMAGKLGNGTSSWPAQTKWANALKDEERLDILKRAKLTDSTAPERWWLTEFEDRSTPRPGTDEVYFEPSADRSAVARHPEIIGVTPFWLNLICCGAPLGLAIAVIWFAFRLSRIKPERSEKT
jgi:hypothetical protein